MEEPLNKKMITPHNKAHSMYLIALENISSRAIKCSLERKMSNFNKRLWMCNLRQGTASDETVLEIAPYSKKAKEH